MSVYYRCELVKDEVTPCFGFNIKGGSDQGGPVVIWKVEEGSLAYQKGIRPKHVILKANQTYFNNITHQQAVKCLRESDHLLLEMLHDGALGSFRGEYYSWIDRHGNPVPPPAPINQQNKRVLNIEINPGQNLGLMIRGGYEYGLGIYVTGVDPGSVADRAGLQRGDELLEVNTRPFTTITHDKAVQILKSSRKMTIIASYIGKIPADNQLSKSDHDELIDLDTNNLVTTATDNQTDFMTEDDTDKDMVLDFNEEFNHVDLEKTNNMIEEKARTVLTKSEHSRFTFYRLEYQQGFLPVQTFVRILLELLNTTDKYTLLTEVRELIRPTDLIQFDELIYNKQTLKRNAFSENNTNNRSTLVTEQEQPPAASVHPRQLSIPPSSLPSFGSNSAACTSTSLVPRVSPINHPQSQSQSQSQPQSTSSQLLISHDPVVAKLQQQQVVNPNSCVRYKVRIQKTKPILGIAIEGGSNTPHRLPRVIDVNSSGSAYGCNLKPGQVLLSCDGKKLDGLTHEEIARSILDSYVDMTKGHIEFIVVEAKASFLNKNTTTPINNVSQGG